ncbi:Pantoate-beta-alanine ligase [Coccomyxa sp. Obi]|nr:Pantoate-beta-alanine ligase [Coccomyxa sp. Obi]
MRTYSRQQRKSDKKIALVPTMGYLHEGHLSLIKSARDMASIVIVSIYVNPTQFAQHEDFGVYPRDEEGDMRKLTSLGVDAVFTPTKLYASGTSAASGDDAGNVVGAVEHQKGAHETFIQVEQLQKPLCGKSRPHFFRGVATVVAKLFNIIEPDIAIFGRKDYQQLLVLQRMARDLDFAVEVVGMPIMREEDGLAMSSRNALLTTENRRKALCIIQSLQWARRAVEERSTVKAKELHDAVASRISEAGGRVDYVEVVDASTLEAVEDASSQRTVIAVAAFFGSVRLIDNIEIT